MVLRPSDESRVSSVTKKINLLAPIHLKLAENVGMDGIGCHQGLFELTTLNALGC